MEQPETYQEWYDYYQAKPSYIAREDVLADTTWVHVCEGRYMLSDSGGAVERTLTIVGAILPDNAHLAPHGDFVPDGDPYRFARAERRFSLVTPCVFPMFFQEDFRKAYHHLQILESFGHGPAASVKHPFLTKQEGVGPKVVFSQAIFTTRTTNEDDDSLSTTEDELSAMEDIRSYPVDPEYVDELQKIQESHTLTRPFGVFYKGGTPCAVAGYSFLLPGQLVEVKFKLASSSFRGCWPEVLSVRVRSPG